MTQDKNPNSTPPTKEQQEQPKQTAVTPNEAHDLDKYSDTLEQTANYGYYSEAEKLLKAVPYAKKNRKKYIFANGYASFYHVISFVLGIATVFLIAKLLINYDNPITFLFSTLIGIVLVALLAGLELFKSSSSTEVFQGNSQRRNTDQQRKIWNVWNIRFKCNYFFYWRRFFEYRIE